jgi:hypothetical protein
MNLATLRVNHRISGGLGMTLGLSGGAFVAFLGLMLFVIWTSFQGGRATAPYEPFYYLSFLLEAGALLIAAPVLLANAIRRDRSRGMLESHRMLPMPAADVLFGYLGALGPVIVFAALNAVLLFALGLSIHFNPLQLAIGLCGFAFDALFIWTLVILWSLIHTYLPSLLTIVLLGGSIGMIAVLYLFPVLTPFYLPLIATGIFRSVPDEALPPALICGLITLALTVLLFIAATRRFRYPQSLGLKPLLATIVFLLLVALTFAGHVLQTQLLDHWPVSDETQLSKFSTCGTVFFFAVAILLPIIAGARWNAERAISFAPTSVRRVGNPLFLILLSLVTIAAPLQIIAPFDWTMSAKLAVIVSLTGYAVLAIAIATFSYRVRSGIIYLWMTILVFAIVLLPIILAGLTRIVLQSTDHSEFEWQVIDVVTAISPVGVAIVNNVADTDSPWYGTIVLWAIAGLLWLMMAARLKRPPAPDRQIAPPAQPIVPPPILVVLPPSAR